MRNENNNRFYVESTYSSAIVNNQLRHTPPLTTLHTLPPHQITSNNKLDTQHNTTSSNISVNLYTNPFHFNVSSDPDK